MHRRAEFSHDVGVVTDHLIPVPLGSKLPVEYASIECTKGAECITTEQGFSFLHVGHHRFRPVHHGCQIKPQGAAAQAQLLHILYQEYIVATNTIKALQHFKCTLVAYNPDVREL
ncbi:hypothetical protein SDC9_171130 [bioreactor metagenome]|uniref:Uncharacterized protein n=1 Tax=bioreactor metagenome TaxID=1076179 RepID=A0A645GA02_9ZZZZ